LLGSHLTDLLLHLAGMMGVCRPRPRPTLRSNGAWPTWSTRSRWGRWPATMTWGCASGSWACRWWGPWSWAWSGAKSARRRPWSTCCTGRGCDW